METMNERQAIVSAYTLRYEKSSTLKDILCGYGSCNSPQAFTSLIKQIYDDDDICCEVKEYAFAILLNRNLVPVGYIKVSEGGIDSTVIDKRLVIKAALDLSATCVVLVHNHPSMNPRPGQADIKETQKLKDALELFDMRLVDHIVYTPKTSYSFADETVFNS